MLFNIDLIGRFNAYEDISIKITKKKSLLKKYGLSISSTPFNDLKVNLNLNYNIESSYEESKTLESSYNIKLKDYPVHIYHCKIADEEKLANYIHKDVRKYFKKFLETNKVINNVSNYYHDFYLCTKYEIVEKSKINYINYVYFEKKYQEINYLKTIEECFIGEKIDYIRENKTFYLEDNISTIESIFFGLMLDYKYIHKKNGCYYNIYDGEHSFSLFNNEEYDEKKIKKYLPEYIIKIDGDFLKIKLKDDPKSKNEDSELKRIMGI